ncbi:hypothetical protein PISMIDRAFT_14195 [Pisolithus microcarpus 441]|uniref:Uncharacterized protein n=1 Tax=Pisolithus microcarpus 441 TaxID=765257 RepID=A0A0C9YQ07_9AGAM|nr:hypothetical protein BKA83DRAFT_14195 [Pisolithus microcarpus]KIK18706.1 hypothetical protein PISMIDRAFT_14195 [Pisolithus microcarpus 441]
MPPVPGPHPSGYLDNENFPMPLGWATNSDWFTGQPYLPPSKSTEVASTPVKPYNLPYAFPTPLQPNPNAQAVNICASASTPQPPNLPPPPPSEIDTYESPSGIGSGNFPTLVTPPTADHSHTNFMVNPYGANRVHGCAKAHCRKMMEGSPHASQPISARNAGCYYAETQSCTRTRTSVGLSRNQSIETPCGWLHEDSLHGIKNMAADVEVLCRWCPLSAQREVIQHNFLRHLREVHLRCDATHYHVTLVQVSM